MGLFVYFSQQMDDVDGSGHMMGIDLLRCSQSSDEFLSLLSPVSLLLTLVGGKTLLGTSLTGVSTYIQVYVQKYDLSFGVRFALIDTLTVALQLSVVMVCLSKTDITQLLTRPCSFTLDLLRCNIEYDWII